MIAGKGQYLIVWDERSGHPRELYCGLKPDYSDIPIIVIDKEKFWEMEIDYERKNGRQLMSLPKKDFFAFWGHSCPTQSSPLEAIIDRLESLKSDLKMMAEYGTYDYSPENMAREVEYLIDDLSELQPNSRWISLEEKQPRAGQFVLMKNESGFIAFACRQKGTDNYYIRHGTRFLDPVAWITKDALLSLE